MTSARNKTKRYNLQLPEDLYEELKSLAEREQTSIVELIRRFIKLGLVVVDAHNDPNASFFIREGDMEREIIFL